MGYRPGDPHEVGEAPDPVLRVQDRQGWVETDPGLTKPLRREVGSLGLRGGDAGEYVLTIYPGGTLGLRRKRQYRELVVSLASVYRLACEQMSRK